MHLLRTKMRGAPRGVQRSSEFLVPASPDSDFFFHIFEPRDAPRCARVHTHNGKINSDIIRVVIGYMSDIRMSLHGCPSIPSETVLCPRRFPTTLMKN
jgi:hypothetical protein